MFFYPSFLQGSSAEKSLLCVAQLPGRVHFELVRHRDKL